ncbi:hypothetical protein QY049_37435 [Bradyrhizobium sp. WYCCWR 13022]|uniref:hypothetical protein n=1 Tax=unclassified Bradyrhizobium TaxID=2631580 RepID=UPI00263BDD38|nr:hypothetical protein [Bradyrhizobium sp. WYCCWR 13022]MDN4988832.1 hypothetical protein [Bradyrhizobium sp. WYCCWR 13022]
MKHERFSTSQSESLISRDHLMVSDTEIRKQLQLAGLRFMYSRAMWLAHEAKVMGLAVKNGSMTTAELDARLEEIGALDLVYPELMRA